VDAAEAPVKKGRRRPSARKDEAALAPAEPMVEVAAEEVVAKPKRTRKKVVPAEAVAEPAVEVAESEPALEEKPKRRSRAKAAEASTPTDVQVETILAEGDDGKPRRGWWQRTFGADE
jgi:ribonuclease E